MDSICPKVIVAEMIDLDLVSFDKVSITSVSDEKDGIDSDIVEINFDEKEKSLDINVKIKGDKKAVVFDAVKTNSAFQKLFLELEHQFNIFELDLEQEERRNVLGFSPLVLEICDGDDISFSKQQQAIVAYYQPFADTIKSDTFLAEQCLNFILKQQIRVLATAPVLKVIPNAEVPPIGSWQLDVNALVGGVFQAAKPSVKILIELTEIEKIRDYIPGGVIRNFLENGLCPLFISEDIDWFIEITAPALQEKWDGIQEIGCGYLDVNFIVK